MGKEALRMEKESRRNGQQKEDTRVTEYLHI